jgi:DNA-binding transcriptional LysR family regulator
VHSVTWRVALTEAGRLYHAQCVQIFNHLADADAMIASLNSEPSGLLRVSFQVAFGRLKLSEIISEFLDAYPKVRVEANYTDRFVDLIEESYDAVVRITALSGGNVAHDRSPPTTGTQGRHRAHVCSIVRR